MTILFTSDPPMVTFVITGSPVWSRVPVIKRPTPSAPVEGETVLMFPGSVYVKNSFDSMTAPVSVRIRIGPLVPLGAALTRIISVLSLESVS